MKPRTPIQQEVARLSERLPKLTATQRAYAFRHCFKHYAIKRADGTNICTECGHSWRSEHDLADTVCGCTCPHCGMKLEALRTRKSVFSENEYFCIITTCKQYQVIRFFFVKSRYKAGQAAEYSIYEVVQRWISPKGTTVTVARLRGMSILYYDLWAEYSDMEVRKNNKLRAYDINPVCTYPRQRFIPELKRNGMKGKLPDCHPMKLMKAVLTDSRMETILKSKDLHAVSYFVNRPLELDRCWQPYKVATRHHYRPSDMGLWADTIRLLEQCGKDICNPKYICPQNLRAEHDYWMNRHNQMEQKRKSQEQMQRAKRKEAEFYKEKSHYFGITITDKDLVISVLDSLEAFQAEGNALHHCVFQCEYYAKADSLILSAHDKEGNRIETIEFSLTEGKVIQSRGLCNTNTPHHDRIVRLVNAHAHQILAAKQTA